MHDETEVYAAFADWKLAGLPVEDFHPCVDAFSPAYYALHKIYRSLARQPPAPPALPSARELGLSRHQAKLWDAIISAPGGLAMADAEEVLYPDVRVGRRGRLEALLHRLRVTLEGCSPAGCFVERRGVTLHAGRRS